MTVSRRLAALLAAVACTGALGLLAAVPAHAQAPQVAAWWNAANPGGGAPAPPPPPDVAASDLYVAGSNSAPAAPAPVGSGNAAATAQAVAGLEFDIPPGAAVGTLTLPIDGTPPPQVSVIACQATRTFVAEQNGAGTDIPPSRCPQTPVTGVVTGNNLVFAGVRQLASGSTLALVLLPGPLDRVVLKAPTAGALAVSGGSAASAPIPFGPGTPVAAAPAVGAGVSGGVTGGVSGGSGSLAGSVPTGSLPAGSPLDGSSAGGVPPPLVAGSTQVPAPQVAPSGSQPGTSLAAGGTRLTNGRWRRLVALALVAAEVVGFVLLQRRRTPGTVVAAAASTVGGRLRPPDVSAVGVAVGVRMRGVGRFTRPRTGPAPRL